MAAATVTRSLASVGVASASAPSVRCRSAETVGKPVRGEVGQFCLIPGDPDRGGEDGIERYVLVQIRVDEVVDGRRRP